jgi:hypothetical protein
MKYYAQYSSTAAQMVRIHEHNPVSKEKNSKRTSTAVHKVQLYEVLLTVVPGDVAETVHEYLNSKRITTTVNKV